MSEQPAALAGMEFLQNRDFEFAQFAIGHDQKISRSRRPDPKKVKAPEPRMKILQRPPPACILSRFQPLELRAKIVEKQRLDHLQYVFLAGVMGSLLAAGNLCSSPTEKSEPKIAGGIFEKIEAAGVEIVFRAWRGRNLAAAGARGKARR